MKAAGILDKLGDDVDEDIIVEMDSMSKRLMRKQRGISKEKEAANKAVAASLRLAGRAAVYWEEAVAENSDYYLLRSCLSELSECRCFVFIWNSFRYRIGYCLFYFHVILSQSSLLLLLPFLLLSLSVFPLL